MQSVQPHDTRSSRRLAETQERSESHTTDRAELLFNDPEPEGRSSTPTTAQTDGANLHIQGIENDPDQPRLESTSSPASWTKEILALGRELGLEGRDLQDFVKEERQTALEITRQREEAERAERERARDREFQLEQLRIQAVPQQNDNNNARENRYGDEDYFKPKIPFLSDKDDIESWFHQFEHYAEDCHLNEGKKASRLIYFLTGKARVIYSKLTREDARSYHTLKSALYEGFQLNAEEYRTRFRQAKKDPKDSYKEHINRLERYLTKWIELDNGENSVEGLIDLMLREQILETLPPELAIHVKDRNPCKAKDIGEIATQYELNRSKQKTKTTYADRQTRSNNTNGFTDKDRREGRQVNSERDTAQKEAEKQKLRASGLCFYCKQAGHMSRNCPKKTKSVQHNAVVKTKEVRKAIPIYPEKLCANCKEKEFPEETEIKIDGRKVIALRDSGCTGIMVCSKLIDKDRYLTVRKRATMAEKGMRKWCPTAVAHIDSPYFIGDTEVSILENPIYPVLIGKWHGIGDEKEKTPIFPVRDPDWYQEGITASVTTRSESRKEDEQKNYTTSGSNADGVQETKMYSPEDLRKAQKDDATLARIRQMVESGEEHNGVKYILKKDILYRSTISKNGVENCKVVVPKLMRKKVLTFGHDHPMAGHLGQKKTMDRIKSEFWWPGFGGDVKRHCLSCDVCQRSAPRSRFKRVPLGQMPTIDPMFKKVAIDIVGPIKPMSETKKQYILVMVDYGTRYPEAVALKDVRAETVAEALWETWTRLGIPDAIVTDQGTQFTCNLMREINSFLKIKHNMTAPFHPQSNGLVEKFNGTLKSMLKKLAIEQPTKWDTFIPALLFAYREAPQDSLGFSPFELLYGKTIKGPMQILRQTWTDETVTGDLKTTAEYVVDLRNRIEETCKIARENLKTASRRQAKYFNRRAVPRSIAVGKKVLLLRPLKQNKLELTWRGPYVVTEKINTFDYRIKIGPKEKVFHINLMKEYLERDGVTDVITHLEDNEDEEVEERMAVVIEEDETMDDNIFEVDAQKSIPLLETQRTEDENDIHFFEKLTLEQIKEAKNICQKKSNFLTDVPKTCNLVKCQIKVTEQKPVFVKPRPIPHAMVGTVEKEIDEMLKLGVIEPATSAYNAPIVLVKKKDGKYRFCCDLRSLNDVTVFDAEPITDVEHLFQSLGKAKFFSKLDLTKGYWAIPIEEEDRDKTAFTTTRGQFRWVNMPFGLKTATGVFNRMMRKLLGPLKCKDMIHHFMDDILIASETWEEHMQALRAVLQRLEDANIAAKPSKCYIGYDELPYLGHEIGGGKRWPDKEKIDKVREASPPTTKKELRSFLGLTGFYREYIRGYSTIAVPLTDMTKKDHPERLQWNDECKTSFEKLKESICEKPVLCMPDQDKGFVLRTDASDRGIGAILLQENGGQLRPIAYQSKKLHGAESRYATVEKECLAAVWGVQRFERYLYGRHFILETDHQPLKCLQRLPTNPRLIRWALQLQPYSYTVRVIPGKDNHGADYLSRMS